MTSELQVCVQYGIHHINIKNLSSYFAASTSCVSTSGKLFPSHRAVLHMEQVICNL